MKGLSCPAKPSESVSKGKRFDVVWELHSMKLPSDYPNISQAGEERLVGHEKIPEKSVWFSEAESK